MGQIVMRPVVMRPIVMRPVVMRPIVMGPTVMRPVVRRQIVMRPVVRGRFGAAPKPTSPWSRSEFQLQSSAEFFFKIFLSASIFAKEAFQDNY